MKSWFSSLLVLAACGDGGSKAIDAATVHDSPKAVDAAIDAKVIDAPPPPPDAPTNVVTVACPTTPDATVTTSGFAYVVTPVNATIPVNGIVKFTTTTVHDVQPTTTACTGCVADPGIHVPFNQASACRQFKVAGDYGMICSIHGFMASIKVQ